MFAVQLVWTFYLLQYVGCYAAVQPWVGITGGHKISISNAPFIASLVRYTEKLPNGQAKVDICGGSIVHERFILTAAHCVKGDSYYDLIRVGSSELYSGGFTYNVEKFIAHENFSANIRSFEYDIALVKLKDSVKFNENVSKISLADKNLRVKPFSKVNVTGWGRMGVSGRVSKTLRQVSVQVRPIKECKIYPWVTNEEICIWSYHKGSCKGDSGGPMTLGNVQIGVVSNGMACGYMPSIFTKVSFLLSWIEDNIKKNL